MPFYCRWISVAWAYCTVPVPVSKLGPSLQEIKKSNELLMRSGVIMKPKEPFRWILHQFIEFLRMGRDRVSEKSPPSQASLEPWLSLGQHAQLVRGPNRVFLKQTNATETLAGNRQRKCSILQHFQNCTLLKLSTFLGPVLDKVLPFGDKRRIYLC